MCISCGCDKPTDDVGNSDNIVLADLEKAAAASDTSVADFAENIGAYAAKAREHESSNSS